MTLAIGIGLQNMPEGLVVALALAGQGYSRTQSWWLALLTGLVEPVGALIGLGALMFASALLPWGMAFAAGAMLFVVSGEIIPESHRDEDTAPTFGILGGFVVMMTLDVALG